MANNKKPTKGEERYEEKDKTSERNERRFSNSRRNPSRGGSRSRKGNSKQGCGSSKSEDSFNDLSWYSHSPELLASAAMLAFPNKPGMEVSLPTFVLPSAANTPIRNATYEIPGVMNIVYEYTIGISEDVTSPASIAAKELWGAIRSKFSSTLGYDAPDLFMYMISLDQIHAYISLLKRVYRILNVFTPQNLYLPYDLVGAALGVHNRQDSKQVYDILVGQKVQLWNYINTLVNMTNKFTFPDQFDLFHRHRWMNEHVYADSPSMMSQLYVFTPMHFWEIDDTGANGTSLIPDISLGDIIVEGLASEDIAGKLYQAGIAMISALSNWEDAYTINGHLLRAFEGSNNFVSALMLQDEIIEIAYVPEVLSQIHNITVMESFVQTAVTQDPNTNAVLYHPTINNWDNDSVIIDMDTVTPSPAEVTLATRLTSIVEGEPEHYKLHCGSEVVVRLWITVDDSYRILPRYDGWTAVLQTVGLNASLQLPATTVMTMMDNYAAMGKWFKAPIMYTVLHNPPTGDPALDHADVQIWGDLTNVTKADTQFISTLHRVCLYSQFNCFGKYTRIGAGKG